MFLGFGFVAVLAGYSGVHVHIFQPELSPPFLPAPDE